MSSAQRAVEQIVGRERRERLSQLAWCGGGCFDSRRRVNSTVIRLAQLSGEFAMRHLFCSGILFLAATACASPTFAQRNDQLIPNDLAVAIRRVMAPVDGTAWVHAYFAGSEMGDVAIVGIADKGTSCPAMFRIVY